MPARSYSIDHENSDNLGSPYPQRMHGFPAGGGKLNASSDCEYILTDSSEFEIELQITYYRHLATSGMYIDGPGLLFHSK